MANRPRRAKSQLPDVYYDGYLEKRSFKDKTYRKLWTCLCGSNLFFFNEKRDSEYVEKLDLCALISVTDDSSQDSNLEAARFNVQMMNSNIKFTAPNAESRELWKGFILSVAEMQVPPLLNLLPGQIHLLKETVEKEKERLANPTPTPEPVPAPTTAVKPSMPACYYEVPRLEAELLLEKEVSKGNLLLRPSRDGQSFAMTARHDLERPIFRHYRIGTKPGGGVCLELDKPLHFNTLHDVVAYMVENTDGYWIPLNSEGQYDKNIPFPAFNKENGERTLEPLQDSVPAPEDPLPVTVTLTPEEPKAVIEENLSATGKVKDKEVADDGSSAETPSTPQPKPVPPTPAPRKLFCAQLTTKPASPKTVPEKSKIFSNPEIKKQILPAALAELKQRLVQKRRIQD